MPGAHHSSFFSLLFFLLFLPFATSLRNNRTIDDTHGDVVTGFRPVYNPPMSNVWKTDTCTDCLVNPERGKARLGTWHSATATPALKTYIDLQFTGTDIYIFFIIPKLTPNADTGIACDFIMDGTLVGSILKPPSTAVDDIYDALVFSTTGLPNTAHNLQIVSQSSSQTGNVLTVFDYAIYTHDDNAQTVNAVGGISESLTASAIPAATLAAYDSVENEKKSSVPVGGIVASVIAVIAVLSLALAGVIFCRRRRRSLVPRPFDAESKMQLDPAPMGFVLPNQPPYREATNNPLSPALPSSTFMHTAVQSNYPARPYAYEAKHMISSQTALSASDLSHPYSGGVQGLTPPPRSFYNRKEPAPAQTSRPVLRIHTDLPPGGRATRRGQPKKQHQKPSKSRPRYDEPPLPAPARTSKHSKPKTKAKRTEVARMRKQVEAMREYANTISTRQKNKTTAGSLSDSSDVPPEYSSVVALPPTTLRRVTNW